MKHLELFTLASAATLLFAACSKPTITEPTVEATLPEPTPIPKVVAVATPAPATPEPNYFAPDGVYFLTVKKAVETSDGITGIRPGARLQKQADGTFRTTENLTVTAADFEVTNDLRVAQQMVASDAAATAALRQQMATWHAAEQQLLAVQRQATPVPAGVYMSSVTSVAPNGQTTTTTYQSRPYATRSRATPVPTPANALERGTYGEKQVFGPRDADGRSFKITR